jgi:hypothetical protein
MEENFADASVLLVRFRNDLTIMGDVVIDIDFVKSIDGVADTFLGDLILRQIGYALGKIKQYSVIFFEYTLSYGGLYFTVSRNISYCRVWISSWRR